MGGMAPVCRKAPDGMKLDPIDLRILDAIPRDGRISKVELAERAGPSPTPCWVRRSRRAERRQTGSLGRENRAKSLKYWKR
jgi:hypothetical protein